MKKKILTLLLSVTVLSLNTACGQKVYEDVDVNGFAKLIAEPSLVILDVRTAEEFNEGHIEGAVNVDYKQDGFVEKSLTMLPKDQTIAVYCRSGRRSASAAELLAAEGYKPVNLLGGILAWKEANMPVTTDTYEVDVFQTKSGKTSSSMR